MNCFDFSIMPRRLTDKTPHSLACHTFAQNLNSTIMARGYKTGGRKTGTPNKTTTFCKEVINEVLAAYNDDGWLHKDLYELSPKERLDVIIKLASFVLPKPQSVQVDVQSDGRTLPSVLERLAQLAQDNEQ